MNSWSGQRWFPVALVLSLAVNFLVLGLFLGEHLATKPKESQPGPGLGIFGQRAAQLPQDEKKKLMTAIRSYRPAIRDARQALAEARGQLASVIAASNFDTDGATKAFADVRAASDALQQKIQEATVVALATLSEESRRHLAEGLEPKP